MLHYMLAKSWIHLLCTDTGCSKEDLPWVMREPRKSMLSACFDDYIYIYIYIYIYKRIYMCVHISTRMMALKNCVVIKSYVLENVRITFLLSFKPNEKVYWYRCDHLCFKTNLALCANTDTLYRGINQFKCKHTCVCTQLPSQIRHDKENKKPDKQKNSFIWEALSKKKKKNNSLE